MAPCVLGFVRQPVDDYLAALGVFARRWNWARLALLLGSLAATWWVYVPAHELAHAFGCLLGGGSVTRLDIDPLYGAALLRRLFPFVHVGSDYAGQLSGFDTHGSDLVYLLTDVVPFAATVVAGVPLLHAAARSDRAPARQAILFGAAMPLAFAPFMSLTGDYYEMGSILVSRLARSLGVGLDPMRWRGDDLLRVIDRVHDAGGGDLVDAIGVGGSFAVGCVLALATYAAGVRCAGLWGVRRPATA